MVYRTQGWYVMAPFKADRQGMTQGGPVLPLTFNIMAGTIAREWPHKGIDGEDAKPVYAMKPFYLYWQYSMRMMATLLLGMFCNCRKPRMS